MPMFGDPNDHTATANDKLHSSALWWLSGDILIIGGCRAAALCWFSLSLVDVVARERRGVTLIQLLDPQQIVL